MSGLEDIIERSPTIHVGSAHGSSGGHATAVTNFNIVADNVVVEDDKIRSAKKALKELLGGDASFMKELEDDVFSGCPSVFSKIMKHIDKYHPNLLSLDQRFLKNIIRKVVALCILDEHIDNNKNASEDGREVRNLKEDIDGAKDNDRHWACFFLRKYWHGTDYSHLLLTGKDLSFSRLDNLNFMGADFTRVRFFSPDRPQNRTSLKKTDINGATLKEVKELTAEQLSRADFKYDKKRRVAKNIITDDGGRQIIGSAIGFKVLRNKCHRLKKEKQELVRELELTREKTQNLSF